MQENGFVLVGDGSVCIWLSVANYLVTTFSLAPLVDLCGPRLGSIQLCKAHGLQLHVDKWTCRWQSVAFPQFPSELEFRLSCCETVAW